MTRFVNTEDEQEQRQDDDEERVVSVVLGSADQFEPGRLRSAALTGDGIMPADREIGVLLTADGRWHAVRNLCPHRGGAVCRGRIRGTMLPTAPGTLEYGLDGKILVCPWHQHEFDVESGECLFIDDQARLVKYPVEVADGEVRVQVTAIGPAVGGVDVVWLPDRARAALVAQGAEAAAYE